VALGGSGRMRCRKTASWWWPALVAAVMQLKEGNAGGHGVLVVRAGAGAACRGRARPGGRAGAAGPAAAAGGAQGQGRPGLGVEEEAHGAEGCDGGATQEKEEQRCRAAHDDLR
jgi:hypothetical protein